MSLKQVEFNTISSSFGALSQNVAKMHRLVLWPASSPIRLLSTATSRYLAATTEYFNRSPFLKAENLPPNETIAGLAEGLVAAHRAYGSSS